MLVQPCFIVWEMNGFVDRQPSRHYDDARDKHGEQQNKRNDRAVLESWGVRFALFFYGLYLAHSAVSSGPHFEGLYLVHSAVSNDAYFHVTVEKNNNQLGIK